MEMPPTPPDIVLLGAAWMPRALLRAQLIEEGFEVAATDAWPMLRSYLRSGTTPKLVIVDLQGLEHPGEVLRDLRTLIAPGRVLVVAAQGTVAGATIDELGFNMVKRPIVMKDLVAAATRAIVRSEHGACSWRGGRFA